MLAVTAETENAPEVERLFAQESNDLWPSFAQELEAVSGRTIHYTRSGSLILAPDAPSLEALHARGTVLGAAEVAALVPVLAPAAGGLWVPDEAHVDPRALAEALAVAVLKSGGTILPNEAVVTIDQHGGSAYAVRTTFGRYGADSFLLAAGAWTSLLHDLPVSPVKGEVLAFATPEGFQAPIVWGPGVYLVPRRGRLLVGATVQEVGFDTTLTQAARETLRAKAEALVPSSREWPVMDHWAGLRPKSGDGLPLLGPSHLPNLFVASGQHRNGILFAPAVAARMAAMMQGEGAMIPDFDPRRFAKGTP